MWTFTPSCCLYGYMVSFLLGIHGSMKLLGPVVTPDLTPNIPRCSLKTPRIPLPQPFTTLGPSHNFSRVDQTIASLSQAFTIMDQTGMASLTRKEWPEGHLCCSWHVALHHHPTPTRKVFSIPLREGQEVRLSKRSRACHFQKQLNQDQSFKANFRG